MPTSADRPALSAYADHPASADSAEETGTSPSWAAFGPESATQPPRSPVDNPNDPGDLAADASALHDVAL